MIHIFWGPAREFGGRKLLCAQGFSSCKREINAISQWVHLIVNMDLTRKATSCRMCGMFDMHCQALLKANCVCLLRKQTCGPRCHPHALTVRLNFKLWLSDRVESLSCERTSCSCDRCTEWVAGELGKMFIVLFNPAQQSTPFFSSFAVTETEHDLNIYTKRHEWDWVYSFSVTETEHDLNTYTERHECDWVYSFSVTETEHDLNIYTKRHECNWVYSFSVTEIEHDLNT